MERDISVGLVKVDYLQSWSQIFQSDQTEMARSIWCTNRNFRNFGLNGKHPWIWGQKHINFYQFSWTASYLCLNVWFAREQGGSTTDPGRYSNTVSQCIIFRANESMISLIVWTWFCSFNLLQLWQFSSQFEGKFIVKGLYFGETRCQLCLTCFIFNSSSCRWCQ